MNAPDCSFNCLAAIAGRLAAHGLESGALFAFTNKWRNRLQIPYYDRTGVRVPSSRRHGPMLLSEKFSTSLRSALP